MRLPRIFWVFVLIISVGYFGYSVYWFIWRSFYCADLVSKGAQMALGDLDDYLRYKIMKLLKVYWQQRRL